MASNKPLGRRAPGVANKVTKTIKKAMTEAANNIGGKKGAIGIFEQAAQKDVVAFAGMLTRMVPLEVKEEINNVGGYGDINIISIPAGHQQCPDGNFRPHAEAKALWDQSGLKPEPEVAELIQRAIKKPKGDEPA